MAARRPRGRRRRWRRWSIGVVAAAAVGALIGRSAERSIARSALRQVLIVLGACAVTYAIGEAVGINVTG